MLSSDALVDRGGPFRLTMDGWPSICRAMAQPALQAIERALALTDLNQVHDRICRLGTSRPFSERGIAALNVSMDVPESELARIPDRGPLVIVANHPFGALDGIGLIALLQRRRTDVKILANHLLGRIPGLRDVCLFVDPFGGAHAKQRNLAGMRSAIRWVKQGGALAVFPAGEVSSLDLRLRTVADAPWTNHAAALIRSTGADALPIYFAGRNSSMFQCAGLVCPRLRTLMLPRELLKKQGSRLEVHIGSRIRAEKLQRYSSDDEMSSYLRIRTYLLSARGGTGGSRKPRGSSPATVEPISSPKPVALMSAEIARLPGENCLAQSGEFSVLYAQAADLPNTLHEIGRLRELTFRGAGEGTGRTIDLDQFDQTYLHLLVWNTKHQQVVGAYRMGLTDQIVPACGIGGLYTSTLFRYRTELMQQLGPAIELGRSFVRPEYQKEFAPLALLWKGIACFAAQNPRYRMLFGPVSISNEYHSLTRQLLIEFLKRNNRASDLEKFVAPRNPPRFGPARYRETQLAATVARNIEEFDELVGEIEADRMGMPVLLRQYLKLNAKLLGFNIDPDFGDVLDGLMLVDLTQVPAAVLVRYMGRGAASRFLAHHGASL